jgi:hypothetical protein
VERDGRGSVTSDTPAFAWKDQNKNTSIKIAAVLAKEFHTRRVLQDNDEAK